MTFLWTIVSIAVVLIWALTIVDIIRHRYSVWTTVAWIALVMILPLIGSIVYLVTRKPDPGDADREYRAQANRRRLTTSERSPIATGASLRYAVADAWSTVDVPTVGLILMIVGVLGLILGIFRCSPPAGPQLPRRRRTDLVGVTRHDQPRAPRRGTGRRAAACSPPRACRRSSSTRTRRR